MNPMTPQQFQDHAAGHRRDLVEGLTDARTHRGGAGPRHRLASFGAAALIGATAFFAGGVLDGKVATPPPVVPATPRVAAPECVGPAVTDHAPTTPARSRLNRHRDRLMQTPV